MKQHTSPCVECPFRRIAPAGWLGAAHAEQFIATAESDLRMPCHRHVDYEDPHWQVVAMLAPQCAGRAIYLRNRMKLPRNPEVAAVVRMVQPSADVFKTIQEFLDHHGEKQCPRKLRTRSTKRS